MENLRLDRTLGSMTNLKQKEEIKTTKTMLLVMISFLISWMPLTLSFLFVVVTKKPRFLRDINETFGFGFHCFALAATHLNMVLDPLIYTFRIKEIRDGLKELFKWNIDRRNNLPYSIQSQNSNGTYCWSF